MKRTICFLLLAFLSLPGLSSDKLGLSVVVIDAGHGGKDAGCVSADGKSYEKTITLDIATRLSEKIRAAYPDVKVVMTRSGDKYVTLNDRAQAANDAGGKLFISIHVNSTVKSSPNGFSVHILGQSSNKNRDLFAYNMDVCRRENSVIMLEDDYSTKYEGFDPSDPESYIFMLLMQNSHLEQSLRFAQIIEGRLKGGPFKADRGIWQDPFYVLWKTAMPSVLVELGFISNPSDLAVLRRKSRRDELAERLFEAFAEYKTIYDGSLSTDAGAVGQGTDAAGASAGQAPRSGAAASETAAQKEASGTSSRKESASGTAGDKAAASGQKAASGTSGQRASAPGKVKGEKSEARYAIQIFAASREVGAKEFDFFGFPPKYVKGGKFYKYYISESSDLDEVKRLLPSVKKKYPDAFIVRVGQDSLSPLM